MANSESVSVKRSALAAELVKQPIPGLVAALSPIDASVLAAPMETGARNLGVRAPTLPQPDESQESTGVAGDATGQTGAEAEILPTVADLPPEPPAVASETPAEPALAPTVPRVAPPPEVPVLTPEAKAKLEALTAERHKESSDWLKKVGRWLWILGLLAGGIAVICTMHRYHGSAAARQIEHRLNHIDSTLSDVKELLPTTDASALDAATRTYIKDLATTITADASAVTNAAATLPDEWNGESLRQERRRISDRSAELTELAARLTTEASDSSTRTPDLLKTHTALDTKLGEAKNADLAPDITWPWDFTNQAAAGFVHAIIATLLTLGILSWATRPNGGLRRALIGADGRLSTAQTQAALWTVATFFLGAHLTLRRTPGQFDELDEMYLLLLGGPFAALVIGGAISRGKLADNDIQKVKSAEAQLRDVVSDDDGRASLTDIQFFLFSTLALIGVLVAFAGDPQQLPDIPAGLAMLTSTAALVYTGKKAADANKPLVFSVTRLDPGPITPGSTIAIRGANFVPAGAGGDLDVLSGLQVRYTSGQTVITIPIPATLSSPTEVVNSAKDARARTTNPSSDQILAVVPLLSAGDAKVAVIPASGVPSNDLPVKISDPVAITGAVIRDGNLHVIGVGFAPDGQRTRTTLTIGTSTAVPIRWISDTEIAAPLPPDTAGATSVKVTTTAGESTRTVDLPDR